MVMIIIIIIMIMIMIPRFSATAPPAGTKGGPKEWGS